MKVGDKVYSSWWSLDVKDIDEYTIIGIEDDVIIVPDKLYSINNRVNLCKIDKKTSCYFTTYEKAIDNILHKIQKGIRQQLRLGNSSRLEWYLEKEKNFIKDILKVQF